jgi:DNA-binding FrmR family transcriptional regulator
MNNIDISNLHRIIGQLQGVERLINSRAKVSAIIQQIEAVRGSLKSLEKSIISNKIKLNRDKETKIALDYLLRIS